MTESVDSENNTTDSRDRLRELQRSWELLGREDPLWAILSNPEMTDGRWDLAEFLATGEREIDESLQRLQDLGLAIEWRRALDFGCGIGRLSRALADRFDRVDGVDISAPMIERGRQVNSDRPRLQLHVVTDLNLPFDDGTFDFVYSRLVLQHISTDLALPYISEFVRVLHRDGVAMFQAPSQVFLDELPGASEIRFAEDSAFIEMNVHPRDEVEEAVEAAGGRITAVQDDPCAGQS